MTKRILFFLLLVLFIGCTKNNSNLIDSANDGIVVPGSKEFYPLKIGNVWNYKVNSLAQDGNYREKEYKNEIVSKLQYNGEDYYCFQTSQNPVYINRSDGFHEFSINENKDALIYKYPCSIGDEWNPNYSYVAELMVIVEVPAGKFRCIHYQHRKGSEMNHITYEDVYFAVGIGVVKRIGYSFTDDGVRYKAGETELINYTLQPD